MAEAIDESKSEKSPRKFWPLLIGSSFSLLWGLFIVQYFIRNYSEVSGLPSNSIGDLLAGFFAPLAFLWLFVATLLQRQELELQRQELTETRKVLGQQREEMEKAANENLEQTKIMKENLRNEGERQIYSEVDIILYSVALYIAANWQRSVIHSSNYSHYFVDVHKISDAVNRENSDRVYIATRNSIVGWRQINRAEFSPCSEECQAFINYCFGELGRILSEEKYQTNILVRTRIGALKIDGIVAELDAIKKTFKI
jgi:hypothetical protein